MIRVLVLNGPNLSQLGGREPEVYGNQDIATLARVLVDEAKPDIELDFRQSEGEVEIISWLHEAASTHTPVIFNPAALTHYSYAIRDAATLVTQAKIPLIEVHISNPHARETFRRHSVISPVATGVIAGFGFDSYLLAISAIRRLS